MFFVPTVRCCLSPRPPATRSWPSAAWHRCGRAGRSRSRSRGAAAYRSLPVEDPAQAELFGADLCQARLSGRLCSLPPRRPDQRFRDRSCDRGSAVPAPMPARVAPTFGAEMPDGTVLAGGARQDRSQAAETEPRRRGWLIEAEAKDSDGLRGRPAARLAPLET